MKIYAAIALLIMNLASVAARASDIESRVEQGYVDSNGVKIHYATLGQGPLIVMIHGFPEFWYTWRSQMEGLADKYQTVAIDLRGYNLSDKPEGVENYDMRLLVGDVIAVIKHFGKEKAIVVGHEWGGGIAWNLALQAPQYVDRLIVLSQPHPRGLRRELARNPRQQSVAEYARLFQQDDAEKLIKPEDLVFWVTDPQAKAKYVEALRRSSAKAIVSYWQRNYPRPPYQEDTSAVVKTKMPVLLLYGLDDPALVPDALNQTWDWMGKDLTLITLPNGGHFIQEHAAAVVTRTIRSWLER
jgi:pimeloyl-ACP methyl ester carboxylesterase